MRKAFKKIFIIGFVCFLLMQLYQPARNTDNGQVLPIHLISIYNVPDNINLILANSCYDCHSNNTNYRWYDFIQPARLLVELHIKNGKENLNFSEFGNYSKRKQINKLSRIAKQIKANEMPLASYTFLHSNAKINASQKQALISWADSLSNQQ